MLHLRGKRYEKVHCHGAARIILNIVLVRLDQQATACLIDIAQRDVSVHYLTQLRVEFLVQIVLNDLQTSLSGIFNIIKRK